MQKNTWFTSDTHFGHANIIKYSNRPYSSVEEMDECLIDNWNSVVKPNHDIYHLGDFAFAQKNRIVHILKRLNGRIHFIWGNHDQQVKDEALNYFVWTKHIYELKINKIKIVLCHYPLEYWNKSFHGSYHLHGHTHANLKTSLQKRRMDVGIDSNGMYPVCFEQVHEILKNRPRGDF